jgi:hypothetical protein
MRQQVVVLGGSGNVDTKIEVNKALLISGSGAVTGLPIVKTVSVTYNKWIEIYNASVLGIVNMQQ